MPTDSQPGFHVRRGRPHAPVLPDGARPFRGVIWSAVSSLPQAKEISLSDQRAQARAVVARLGGVIVEELEVPGESRSIVLFEDACARIPAYARLRDLLDARAFDVLVFLDRSRLGRTAALVMTVTALCAQAGVTCYEMDAPPADLSAPHSPDEDLLGAIKAVGAEREVQKLRERHRMGMAGRIKKGLLPGPLPFGYRKVFHPQTGEAIVEADPATAPIVQEIFRLYLAGRGTRAVADHLNAGNVPPPVSARWARINVFAVLRRHWTYAGFTQLAASGTRPFLREPGRHPALLDPADAARVEAEMEHRARNHHLNTPYLLSGICVCAVCNAVMVVNSRPASDRIAGRYFGMVCGSGTPHPNRKVSMRYILPPLREAMEWFTSKADIEALLAEDEPHDMVAAAQSAVAAAASDVARLEAQVYRADELLVSGALDGPRHAAQIKRIAADLASASKRLALARQRAALASLRAVRRGRLEDVRSVGLAMLDHDDVALANAWLREHVRIIIRSGAVERVQFL